MRTTTFPPGTIWALSSSSHTIWLSSWNTFQSLADQLAREGHVFRPSQPRFHRTALSYILNNRFYIGELRRNGSVHEGRYQRLIDRTTFDACQRILNAKNRRTGNPELALSGGLFRCACCGQSITGERIRRALRSGGTNDHVYYRCANNNPGAAHPRIRWRADDLECAVIDDLARMRLPSQEFVDWFRVALSAAFADVGEHERRQTAAFKKRRSELVGMQDRLLNAYLAGTVDEAIYRAKADELQSEMRATEDGLERLGDCDPARGATALAVFGFSQRAADLWRGSNNAVRREILDSVYLNRALSDVTLVTTKRKPFDVLAERPFFKKSRGDSTPIELFVQGIRSWGPETRILLP